MTDIAHVRNGFVNYANSSLIPLLPSSKQFVAGLAVGLAASKADAIADALADNTVVRTLGLIDEHKMIDIDALYSTAKQQLQRGLPLEIDLPFIGAMRLNEADVDALYQSIQRG